MALMSSRLYRHFRKSSGPRNSHGTVLQLNLRYLEADILIILSKVAFLTVTKTDCERIQITMRQYRKIKIKQKLFKKL